jgi:hypothetical protein
MYAHARNADHLLEFVQGWKTFLSGDGSKHQSVNSMQRHSLVRCSPDMRPKKQSLPLNRERD